MALIICPECGKEISDQSPACIHCGYVLHPESLGDATVGSKKVSVERIRKPLIIVGTVFAIVAVALPVYFMNFTISAKYDKADRAFERGDYEKAVNYYTVVGDYKNAATKLDEATTLYNYTAGKSALENNDWLKAK